MRRSVRVRRERNLGNSPPRAPLPARLPATASRHPLRPTSLLLPRPLSLLLRRRRRPRPRRRDRPRPMAERARAARAPSHRPAPPLWPRPSRRLSARRHPPPPSTHALARPRWDSATVMRRRMSCGWRRCAPRLSTRRSRSGQLSRRGARWRAGDCSPPTERPLSTFALPRRVARCSHTCTRTAALPQCSAGSSSCERRS